MKMPKSVNILGVIYTVKTVGSIENTQDISGLCDPLSLTISIHKDLNPRMRKEVLYHEIVHAVLHECGVTQTLSPQIEEVICETVGKAFARLS